MLRALLFCLPLLLLAGCGQAPAVAAGGKTGSGDPEQDLYEKVKAARYQIGVATDRFEQTINLSRGLAEREQAEVRQALNTIAESLAKAGSKVADFDEEPPALNEFKASFAEQDDARLKAIEACNSALKEVADAMSLTDDLLASEPPEEEKKALTEIKGAIQEGQDALESAVQEMDGVVQ
ncbi:MAG: hypothetical protein ACAH95_13425 [Fimbriimonas sp.]